MGSGIRRYRFRPHERLHSPAEYRNAKKQGTRRRTGNFIVNIAANGLPYHRLGLVVQKKYWNAVGRNRIKRRLREWFRLHKDQIPSPGKDVVIVALPGAERLSFGEIAGQLLEATGRSQA
jgi:ribonuclease P protein component